MTASKHNAEIITREPPTPSLPTVLMWTGKRKATPDLPLVGPGAEIEVGQENAWLYNGEQRTPNKPARPLFLLVVHFLHVRSGEFCCVWATVYLHTHPHPHPGAACMRT